MYLLIGVIVVILYTHHTSPFHILILLLLFYIFFILLQFFVKDNEKFNPFPIFLLLLAFLIHWYYVARDTSIVFEIGIKSFFISGESFDRYSTLSSQAQMGGELLQNSIESNLNNLPSLILVFFVLIGIGFAIKKSHRKILWTFAFLALISLGLWLPNGISALILYSKLEFSRFAIFTIPFTLIIFAFGFYYLLNYYFKTTQKYIIFIIISLFIIYSLLSLIQIPFYDNGVMNDEYSGLYLNKEDMTSLNFFETKTNNDVSIITDIDIKPFFTAKQNSATIKNIGWHYYQTKDFKGNDLNNPGDYIFYRKEQFKKISLEVGPLSIPYKDHKILKSSVINLNKIFNTGNNEIFNLG